jgi:hypothetical protein
MRLKRLVPMTLADREQIRKLAIALQDLERRRARVRQRSPLIAFVFAARAALILAPQLLVRGPQLLFGGPRLFLRGLKRRRRRF